MSSILPFDRHEMTWHETGAEAPVRLIEAQEWNREHWKLMRTALAAVDDIETQKMVTQMFEPKLNVSTEGDRLILRNDFVRYEIQSTQSFSGTQFERLFAYDQLNAYRKAMLDRKVPPYLQLAVSRELESRKLAPSEMSVTAKTKNGELRVHATTRIESMTDAEVTQVKAAIAGAGR